MQTGFSWSVPQQPLCGGLPQAVFPSPATLPQLKYHQMIEITGIPCARPWWRVPAYTATI